MSTFRTGEGPKSEHVDVPDPPSRPRSRYRTVLATIVTVALVGMAASGGVLAYEAHRQTDEERHQTACAAAEATANRVMADAALSGGTYSADPDYRRDASGYVIATLRACAAGHRLTG